MSNSKVIIDSTEPRSSFLLRDTLYEHIKPETKLGRDIIFLCVGTDRSTGDSLGPLVGDKLKFLSREQIHVYGNLQYPVHAKNLTDTIDKILSTHNNPYIIAIDACLGALHNVGKIIVEAKPLTPGSAMNKDLPQVGNLSITGVVNISGALDFMILQNTRLYTVMLLADVISRGIYHSILKTVGGKKCLSTNQYPL
ncbi:MAG: spore protease YyaC [Clostridiales bacterium]|uniref:spore protease YyaC n=1 Tax=Clostridium sp. N3C TaxID=1776758 RepID=UPI00092E08FB|nr:spore protease YyaC [Clostridium sp. N3C]NLZ49552.1 spore protease YyaC [Clostridiales bacterium]SCN25587.1 putative sporulation protein YyaC [Clostridium sp. N3C]